MFFLISGSDFLKPRASNKEPTDNVRQRANSFNRTFVKHSAPLKTTAEKKEKPYSKENKDSNMWNTRGFYDWI